MIVLCATISAFVASCVYDWEVGAPASTDAGPGTGGAGGSGGGGADCADLLADLDAARIAAKSCVLGASGQCAEKVTDECGCHSFVKAGGSAEAQSFAAAVEAFLSADCKPSCAGGCSVVVSGMCLIVGGQGPYCTP
ncbi:hypothetical protein KEG38_10685 [Polyangium jinanense]|uniref:hypothetical protein n=1 Tax=Polyangium jinanense TaxID=2829994 RepID=UPI002340CE30|nr:hypothetical protein [Polyangium jinanense]MDC3954317.1 hypothetical protein [Polyangium jinanense]